jgi:uncharacterized membrane protein
MMHSRRRFSLIFIKATFFFSFLGFTTLNLVAAYGLLTGIHLSALCWTVYVMCLPFSGGGILFYPLTPLTGVVPAYVRELWAWILSIVLHCATFASNRILYEKTSVTHFIYWGIIHPIPYWFLFFVCFLPVIAAWLYKVYRIPHTALWYYHIRALIMLLALFLLVSIALRDIIILSNIHA